MNKIKFLKKNEIELNGIRYKPYTICSIPTNFGCIAYEYDSEGIPTREGIAPWFNYKGLTYIIK